MTIPVSDEGLDLMREIAASMVARFKISDDEAVVRGTAYFDGWNLTDRRLRRG
ncbi:hypothetical protein [Streptomyces sp. NPDC086787]|uniref:hypothetical protein n=1 Tax=Streptomyces sp. NPDC086787 TaxID=3365759 RepID=UPI0037F21E3C